MNFSTASSITLPHPEEGAALLRGRLPPSFSVSPFRPGNLGLFGALLQPPAAEKKETNEILCESKPEAPLVADLRAAVAELAAE